MAKGCEPNEALENHLIETCDLKNMVQYRPFETGNVDAYIFPSYHPGNTSNVPGIASLMLETNVEDSRLFLLNIQERKSILEQRSPRSVEKPFIHFFDDIGR